MNPANPQCPQCLGLGTIERLVPETYRLRCSDCEGAACVRQHSEITGWSLRPCLTCRGRGWRDFVRQVWKAIPCDCRF